MRDSYDPQSTYCRLLALSWPRRLCLGSWQIEIYVLTILWYIASSNTIKPQPARAKYQEKAYRRRNDESHHDFQENLVPWIYPVLLPNQHNDMGVVESATSHVKDCLRRRNPMETYKGGHKQDAIEDTHIYMRTHAVPRTNPIKIAPIVGLRSILTEVIDIDYSRERQRALDDWIEAARKHTLYIHDNRVGRLKSACQPSWWDNWPCWAD